MPTYDFKCGQCGLEFDAFVEVSRLAACPACGTPDAKRLYRPIAPPARTGLRGLEAKRSNDSRRVREELRQDGFRKQREQMGLPPRKPEGS